MPKFIVFHGVKYHNHNHNHNYSISTMVIQVPALSAITSLSHRSCVDARYSQVSIIQLQVRVAFCCSDVEHAGKLAGLIEVALSGSSYLVYPYACLSEVKSSNSLDW